jgi:hypothetical protein
MIGSAAVGADPDRFYRTTDMALVTWLRYSGHEPQAVSWQQRQCGWIFHRNHQLMERVDAFHEGSAKPEVREYNRLFGVTKAEFYNAKPGR